MLLLGNGIKEKINVIADVSEIKELNINKCIHVSLARLSVTDIVLTVFSLPIFVQDLGAIFPNFEIVYAAVEYLYDKTRGCCFCFQ